MKFELPPDRVVQCEDCGMVFADATRFAGSGRRAQRNLYNQDYYNSAYASRGYLDYPAEFSSHRATFAARLCETERRIGRKGRLLDIGCAFGHLAKTATDLGWDVFGTDISGHALRHARVDHGARVFLSDLRHLPVKNGLFDVITLYDVIEHFSEPGELLAGVLPLLRPDGLLHLTTPDVASLSARLMGRRWYHYKSPEHLVYFSPATLTRALRTAGFDVVGLDRAPSRMSVISILRRMRRYSRFAATSAIRIARVLGCSERILTMHIGEFQAWARPRSRELLETPSAGPRLPESRTRPAAARGATTR